MCHGNVDQRLRNTFNVWAQSRACFPDPSEHRGRRDLQCKQLGYELWTASQRQQLAFAQVHRQRAHVRTILHDLGHAVEKLPLVLLPAGATQLPRAMFGDLVARDQYVKHAPPLVQPGMCCFGACRRDLSNPTRLATALRYSG